MTAPDPTLALRASRQRLLDAISGLEEEQFRHSPDGAWSIAAHIAHLLRTERAYGGAARAALTGDGTVMTSTAVDNDDDPGLAQRLAVPQIVHGLQACRRDLEAAVEEASARGVPRTITHERIGPMTVEDVARKMASHEDEHAAGIEALARAARSARPAVIPLTQR